MLMEVVESLQLSTQYKFLCDYMNLIWSMGHLGFSYSGTYLGRIGRGGGIIPARTLF
jgi:hypothetical protein